MKYLFPTTVLLAAFAAACDARSKPTLKVGDMAPGLAFGKCFKGQKLQGFQKGQIYVIDFWATRCAPCVAAIPHLSDLAKRYAGKVTVTGVSVQVWPGGGQNDTPDLVADFLKTPRGKAMQYNVLADTPNGFMINHWFDPAGYDSIPVCFVVGANGRIAWMGRPKYLEAALEHELLKS